MQEYTSPSSGNSDVANLIMIGTPNAGDPLANLFHTSDRCKPAVFDLEIGAPDTMASKNTHTNYYTIAGECLPFLELPFHTALLFQNLMMEYTPIKR